MLTINHDTSYSVLSKSELITNITIDYILHLNEENGILPERSIFGKHTIVSDTEVPNKRRIVLSKIPRTTDDGFKTLNLDDDIVELTFLIHRQDIEQVLDKVKYIKQKLKKRDIEIQFYLTSAILGTGLETHIIDRVIDHHYKGIHTATERYQVLIDFVNSPSETQLYHLLNIFNEENHQQLINTISSLTYDTPDWVSSRFGDIIKDSGFTRTLLKIALTVLKTKSRDEFILSILKGVIYE